MPQSREVTFFPQCFIGIRDRWMHIGSLLLVIRN